jgi:hypothetical protein
LFGDRRKCDRFFCEEQHNFMNRSQAIFSAVDHFNSVHNQWVDDTNSEHPTLVYWQAFDEMLATIESELPGDCRRLATAIYDLAAERAKFDLADVLYPHDDFWRAREEVQRVASKARAPAQGKYRESIAELDRQKVPHEQIARIWGLVSADGTGKAWLVQQELDKPGSVITATYVHPDDVAEEKRASEAKLKYQNLAGQVTTMRSSDSAGEAPCPETSYELWLQKVSLPQAARMLKRDEESVAEEWRSFAKEVGATLPVDIPVASTPPPAPDQTEEPDQPDPASEVYDAFDEWSDEDLKSHAKKIGISVRGPFNRNKMIDKILEAEEQGVEVKAE